MGCFGSDVDIIGNGFFVYDQDVIGQGDGFIYIVCYQQYFGVMLCQQLVYQGMYVDVGECVEGGEGFIQQ